ncbi:unnamed protein product [Clonostachys byssicola]|uniref:DUF221-domain-containing protein n=1 Tax=Clonostachys byssicola TaxID=160290 RepID=A0A9N9XXW7_9HYPO|nr:unnamed protein product [Clonostachys byssicola]
MDDPTYAMGLGARVNGDIDDFVNLLKNPFRQQAKSASIWAALAVSVSFTLLTTIFFSVLRPHHQSLYAPRLKHADEKHAPPPIGKQPWAWVTPLWKTSEANLVGQIGMDATIFLRFVRMCRNIFLSLMIIGICILAPIHWTQSEAAKTTEEDGDSWPLKLTPLKTKGRFIWSQVVVAYLFNLTIAFFLWYNYKKVVALRRAYFESDEYQNSLHARTLMLFDIPKQGTSDEGIARIIDQVAPNSSFARTVVARNVKDLPDLISQHEHAVRKLEKVLAKYLKNPNQLPPGRPTCNPSKRDRARDTYVKGQKLDAIEYYTQRIRQLELQIQSVRSSVDRRSTQPYGFASYAEISEAHNIAYLCRNKKPHGTTVKLAPRPNDLIWKNMPLTPAARSRSKWFNGFWITLLTIFWIVPNALIAIFLVDLSNLATFWKGFGESYNGNPKVWGVVQGILSPAIMSLVYLVLPMIFRRLQIRAGDKTKTGRDRHVLGKLFAFFVFNNLIVFTVFSVIWSFVDGVITLVKNNNLDTWTAIVQADLAMSILTSLCTNSAFWVTYLLQRQLGAAIDLAQLWPLAEAFFLKKFSSPTPRELIELTAPPPFDYSSYYNYFLFYAAVTLCYSGIQPLVIPATALYFSIDYWLKKYLLLYRFVTKTESGGLFWRVLFNRFIFSAILANLVVLLTTWCQSGGEWMNRIPFWTSIPLPLFMIGFKIYCAKTFDLKLQFYSTTIINRHPESGTQKEDRQRGERLASRFGHPALYKKLITPMVHQKAQNLLPAVYTGRLTDGRDGGADDLATISGYSDMFALSNMQGGKPGKAAGGIPGFEYVSENHMDFEFFKNRAEFGEDHGGGEIYGRQGDIMRPGTPGSMGEGSDAGSRSQSPSAGPRTTRRSVGNPLDTSYQAYRPDQGDVGIGRNHSPLYTQDNGSLTGLVSNAAAPPTGGFDTYSYRHGSMDRSTPTPSVTPGGRVMPSRTQSPGPSVGALGGGPHGYSGLAQTEFSDHDNGDAPQYDYFRGGKGRKPPGQGW